MKNVMLVFGTRPEAIKMCPLVKELQNRTGFRVTICVTGQHREMLKQVLDVFAVVPDYDLAIMHSGQTLFDVTAAVLGGMKAVLEEARPELVLVHGDTSTAFAAALACFYLRIPVGHVEAGLRTYDLSSPFPEEFNRQGVDLLSRWHFAPTERAKQALLREGRSAQSVFVTGNTVIDALKTTVREGYSHPVLNWADGGRLLLVTAHRRENLGAPMAGMFRAVRRVAEAHPDVRAVFPVHRNPAVQTAAAAILDGCDRIRLIDP
ncbi:MAG: UDP-N-acetylglucosamine 2-epimerase (non-hydrolyzing), partial [Oscillospiraceae bacterium]|nr:UDP-N-acetylglucosamine 2-epimerase (non-hydrolyzing) [Oscillospiraceae bacterium]